MEKCWEGREWAIRYDRCVGMITIVPIWLPLCQYGYRCFGIATILPVWMATVVSEWLPSDLSHEMAANVSPDFLFVLTYYMILNESANSLLIVSGS